MKLEDIKKLCDEATPGPWKADHYSTVDGIGEYDFFSSPRAPEPYPGGPRRVMAQHDEQYRKDRAFIAASRTLLPKLLAVAEAAKLYFKERGDGYPARISERSHDWTYGWEISELKLALTALEADDA